jgi:Mn2+/Fe2+ NRAMP family transporter
MGEWVNPPWYNFVSWISVAIVVGLTLALTVISLRGM